MPSKPTTKIQRANWKPELKDWLWVGMAGQENKSLISFTKLHTKSNHFHLSTTKGARQTFTHSLSWWFCFEFEYALYLMLIDVSVEIKMKMTWKESEILSKALIGESRSPKLWILSQHPLQDPSHLTSDIGSKPQEQVNWTYCMWKVKTQVAAKTRTFSGQIKA